MADHNRPTSVLLLLVASFAALAVAGCGGGDTDAADEQLQQQKIEEARDQGAAEAKRDLKLRQQAREQARLRRELRALKRRQRRGGANPPTDSGGTTAPPATSAPPTTATTSCGTGLAVGPNTSCAFAENVRGEYGSASQGGNATIQVFSPATGQSYTMTCIAGATTVCRGGNNAAVYITG